MGYTHYYYTSKTLGTQKEWNEFTNDVTKIINSTDIPLANGMADKDSLPIITNDTVSFNGCEDDSHETLYIENNIKARTKEMEYNFCKTARKPYDLIVMAVLIALKHHFPRCTVSSDGKNNSIEWQAGRQFTEDILGYGLNFNLDIDLS